MNPCRSILEVKFSSPAVEFDFVTSIVRGLGGQGPKDDQKKLMMGPQDIRMAVRDKKMSFHFSALRYAINIEENVSLDETISLMVDMSNRLMTHVHWNTITWIGFRTTWMKRVDNFETLVKRYKEIFFTKNSLVDRAFDVGMPLTFSHKGATINYVSGPMQKGQVAQYGFEFPLDIPDQFAFIDLDYNREPNQPLSIRYLKEFLKSASVQIDELANETLKLLEV